MLKTLEYSVEFPTTGRVLENSITFAPGLTAITGRNESGKSVILEMIGYCLFGKAALRGKASDYKSLDAKLNLDLNGNDVLIERKNRKEKLTVNGEETAVGAEAINTEIPKLLGFGLDVFNIACAAQQGDLGALTEMRPTARRAMIDRLVGLDQLEEVEKGCKTEARAQKTLADGLADMMDAPVEPVQPENYVPTDELDKLIADVEHHENNRAQLLQIEEPKEPVAPEAPEHTDVEALEAHQEQRQAQLQEIARLEGQLSGVSEPTVDKDTLEAAVAYAEYEAEVERRGPKAEYPMAQLDQWEKDWDVIISQTGLEIVECPKCHHEFDPASGCEKVEVPEDPPVSRNEIFAQRQRHTKWQEPLIAPTKVEVPNLKQEIEAHAKADIRRTLAAELEQFRAELLPDRRADLDTARAYQRDAAVFAERKDQYDRARVRYDAAQAELGSLPDRSVELRDLRERRAGCRHYESLKATYERDAERYAELVGRVAAARQSSAGYAAGADSLRNTRAAVKRELAPSLSLAASSLISSMTNGERRAVTVDEDFEVLVDGQPLQTLSGSGKSVVNLALRIGLGQVLTSQVLPIFMGDEVDKDMDAERALSTHSTFQTLREYLTQVIIVTHKEDFEADQVIAL